MIISNLVTVHIIYYRLDYQNLIQEFLWQTHDLTPEIPRVHKFLNFWRDNIEAVIKEINVAYTYEHQIKIARIYNLQ